MAIERMLHPTAAAYNRPPQRWEQQTNGGRHSQWTRNNPLVRVLSLPLKYLIYVVSQHSASAPEKGQVLHFCWPSRKREGGNFSLEFQSATHRHPFGWDPHHGTSATAQVVSQRGCRPPSPCRPPFALLSHANVAAAPQQSPVHLRPDDPPVTWFEAAMLMDHRERRFLSNSHLGVKWFFFSPISGGTRTSWFTSVAFTSSWLVFTDTTTFSFGMFQRVMTASYYEYSVHMLSYDSIGQLSSDGCD